MQTLFLVYTFNASDVVGWEAHQSSHAYLAISLYIMFLKVCGNSLFQIPYFGLIHGVYVFISITSHIATMYCCIPNVH